MKTYSGQIEYNLKHVKRSVPNESLFEMVREGDIRFLNYIRESGKSVDVIKDKDGNTLLHCASQYGHRSIAEVLLKKGMIPFTILDFEAANVDAQRNDGKTPLHLAAQGGHKYVVESLLKNKANIEATDKKDWTPLHEAAFYGKLDVVELLVKEHADIEARNKDGKTPLHLAAQGGHEDVVKILLENKANIDATDTNDCTPLHEAVSMNKLDVVKFLVKEHADIKAKNKDGKTPLDLANERGYTDIAQFLQGRDHLDKDLLVAARQGDLDRIKNLVEQGAEIEARGEDNETPLHLAVEGGHKGVVEFLLSKKANIEAQDKDKWTPLHYAASYSHLELAQFLVNEKKANINAQSTSDGKKPVHAAAKAGHKEIVEFFLGKGIGVDDADNDKWTPLHYAARYNHLELAQFLLDRGANVKAKNNDSKTPLDLADKTEIIKLLVRKLAELDEVTPLHSAVKYGSSKVVELFINDTVNAQEENHGWTPLHFAAQENKKDIAELLIRKNATVNAKNYRGWTPLHEAASKDKLEVAKLLVEKGADVNAKNNKGWTPLHEAAKKGNSDIVDFLIETNGTDIEARSRNREDTPLHVAAGEGKLKVVQLLANNTANVNAVNKYGRKPLDIARDKNHADVTDFLAPKPSRRRRDVSNEQEFSAASGSAKPISWINDYIAWIKDSASEFIGNIPFKRTTSLLTNNIQVDYGTSPKKQSTYESEDSTKTTISQIDFNGTITLLDLFVRRFTGEKYPSFQGASLSQLEVLGYALNITHAFEKAIEQAAKESGISMHRLSIDFVEVQGEITKKVSGGRFDEIPGVLNSYVEKSCSNVKGGKFSPKKFDRFITAFNNELPQIPYEKERSISLSRANYIENQSFSLKDKNPSNYLEGVSVQGNLTQVKGV